MIKRRLVWLASNTILVASGIFGLFYEVNWALNIFLFLSWAGIVITVLCGGVKGAREERRKIGRSMPRWVDVLLNVAIMLTVAGFGMFTLAVGVLVGMAFEDYTYEGKD